MVVPSFDGCAAALNEIGNFIPTKFCIHSEGPARTGPSNVFEDGTNARSTSIRSALRGPAFAFGFQAAPCVFTMSAWRPRCLDIGSQDVTRELFFL
jgi:hypothetical protein